MMTTRKDILLNTIIPDSMDGKRLDAALAQLFPEYSRAQLQNWIKQGCVTVNNVIITKPRASVHKDQNIHINADIQDQGDWVAQDIPINIVFEDDYLMVINKPIGLVVHPGAGNPDKTLVNALLHHTPELSTIPRAGIIHRLDKDTSGLLVIAKTLPAHTALVQMMQSREIHREYRALVHGKLISGGTIDAPMGRHPTQRIKMAVVKNGKPAVTHYRIVNKSEKYSLLAIKLETGRTHQIRVHMSHIGYPIVGDPVYGKRHQSNIETNFNHQALHAYRLSLTHPITHETHKWEAPLPQDMLNLIEQLLPNDE